MASKGKLKKYEIKCGTKCIDARRFAYDVIVHQVSKFGVPKNCICIWEGPENDYEYPDFFLILSRLFFRHQISLRYKLHENFNFHYESNKLESFKNVGHLLQHTLDNTRAIAQMDFADKVEISLSIVCELVIFLYSKNLNLFLKELACFWFDCYFRLVKKKFEKTGGVHKSYRKGNRLKHEYFDKFYEKFISVHCQSYEASAKNENLEELYYQSADQFKNKILATLTPNECKAMRKEASRDPLPVKCFTRYEFEISLPPSISEEDETSETDLPKNTGLGIIPHEELLKIVCDSPPDTTQSLNIPGKSQQESTKQHRASSGRKKSKFRSSLSVEQGLRRLRLDSSGTKQSGEKKPNVLVANNPRSPSLPGTSLQESASYPKVLSGQQKSNVGVSYSSVKQRCSLDSTVTKLPGNKKPNILVTDASKEAQTVPSAIAEPFKEHRTLSSQDKQKKISNSRSKEEE